MEEETRKIIRPKTIREAQSLPEIERQPWKYEFSPIGIEGDEIIFFVDSDGKSKKVVHTVQGTFKVDYDGIFL